MKKKPRLQKINLLPGEKVVHVQKGGSILSLFKTYTIWLIISFLILLNTKGINKLYTLTTLIPVSVIDYRRRQEMVVLTNMRLLYFHLQYFYSQKIASRDKDGLIMKHQRKIDLRRIHNSNHNMGLVYMTLGKGNIADFSLVISDVTTPKLTLKGINKHDDFEAKLNRYIKKRKEEVRVLYPDNPPQNFDLENNNL